jgi:hypothetical protein
VADESDNLSVSSGGTQRGRPSFTPRRLSSSHDNSSHEGSPGSRVEEYEKEHAQSRKPSDGMIFQIIPSAKDKVNGVSIESFPNGVFALTVFLSFLITGR